MFPSIKNDLLYLLNILESIEKIYIYTGTIEDAEELYYLNDQLNFNAILTLFTNIGENVGKISDALKGKNSAVKWQDIKNFRNKIAHDYIGIDLFIVFRIIKKELPVLKSNLLEIVLQELRNKNFDIVEFKEAQKSFYYRHIFQDPLLVKVLVDISDEGNFSVDEFRKGTGEK